MHARLKVDAPTAVLCGLPTCNAHLALVLAETPDAFASHRMLVLWPGWNFDSATRAWRLNARSTKLLRRKNASHGRPRVRGDASGAAFRRRPVAAPADRFQYPVPSNLPTDIVCWQCGFRQVLDPDHLSVLPLKLPPGRMWLSADGEKGKALRQLLRAVLP